MPYTCSRSQFQTLGSTRFSPKLNSMDDQLSCVCVNPDQLHEDVSDLPKIMKNSFPVKVRQDTICRAGFVPYAEVLPISHGTSVVCFTSPLHKKLNVTLDL